MGIKSDDWIIKKSIDTGMILNGFKPHQIRVDERGKVVSYGVSSYGYDLRLGNELLIFDGSYKVLDPKTFSDEGMIRYKSDEKFVLPPGAFALGFSMERFSMPRNTTGIVFPKSTYARCGINCLQTVIEAGWEGQITLEFQNMTQRPVAMYPGEGVAQLLFFEGDQPCATAYGERSGGGKYQGQSGITLPKV